MFEKLMNLVDLGSYKDYQQYQDVWQVIVSKKKERKIWELQQKYVKEVYERQPSSITLFQIYIESLKYQMQEGDIKKIEEILKKISWFHSEECKQYFREYQKDSYVNVLFYGYDEIYLEMRCTRDRMRKDQLDHLYRQRYLFCTQDYGFLEEVFGDYTMNRFDAGCLLNYCIENDKSDLVLGLYEMAVNEDKGNEGWFQNYLLEMVTDRAKNAKCLEVLKSKFSFEFRYKQPLTLYADYQEDKSSVLFYNQEILDKVNNQEIREWWEKYFQGDN